MTQNTTRMTFSLRIGRLLVLSLLMFVPGTAWAKNLVIGTGQIHTVTERHETLDGFFSGVIIDVDQTFVDLKNAVIDCSSGGGNIIGVDIGFHSRVRIHKGTVRNCAVGVLIGNPTSGGPGGTKNHISGMLVEDSAPVGNLATAFNGAGIVIDSGTNNHVHDNTINNVGVSLPGQGSQGIWVFKGNDNKITNNYVGVLKLSTQEPSGIALTGAVGAIVDANTLETVTGAAVRLIQGADFNQITNNISVNNADPEMVDDAPGCGNNIWRDNVFLTDGGTETDGPNAGCIQ